MNQSTASSDQFIEANGLRIYYQSYGEGRPLILLHGGTLTAESWQPHIPFFANHFQVFTPDTRGHGRTNNPQGKLSYRMMADDTAAFIEALKLQKPFIFGYSDGGQTALELAMNYPGLAGALTAGAVWYKLTDQMRNGLKTFGMTAPGQIDFDLARKNLPERLITMWQTSHQRPGEPDYWKTLLRQISEMWFHDLNYGPDDFQKITDPTLVLIGDRDQFIPAQQALDIYQNIPGAELAVLPDNDHSTLVGDGGLFLNVVLNFFLRHTTEDERQT
jgi:pimeloyl-ACP methyl ester carboxylesterase